MLTTTPTTVNADDEAGDLDEIVYKNYKRYWSKDQLLLNPHYQPQRCYYMKRKLVPVVVMLLVAIIALLQLLMITGRDIELHLERRLPQAIIIGARKCGTRALLDMLNVHPQVQKSPLEVHFFDRDDNYNRGLDWYRSQMPETTVDQLAIEKSPSYFVTPEVPERVYGMNASIKLLLIVRDPVTRVVSDYTQIYYNGGGGGSNGNGTSPVPVPIPSFESLVLVNNSVNTNYKAVRISLYARYLLRWLDVFPLSQIFVIDGELLIKDPYQVLVQVEEFLGLEHKLVPDQFYYNATKGFYCWHDNGEHCLNESKGRRHPSIGEPVLLKLKSFYKQHNELFYEMVGKDFGW